MSGFLRDKHYDFDPVWHVQAAMIVGLSLQLVLPDTFTPGLRYALPLLEALLILNLSLTTPRTRSFRSAKRRINVIALIASAAIANTYSLIVVARQLLEPASAADGRSLILSAINIFITNIIIFALWYWEMDGGGPGERHDVNKYEQDFLFTQHRNEPYKHPNWKPTFVDYLYISSTNAMSFSPGDALPLSRRAKMLMLVQAMVALITIFLVAARAVGILS